MSALLGFLLSLIPAPSALSQAVPAPAVSHRWVGNTLQLQVTGEPGFRYLCEFSTDLGLHWQALGGWRSVKGDYSYTARTNGEALAYRILAERSKRDCRPFAPAAINHILISGQSNAIGRSDGEAAPLSATQPFENVMFNPFTKLRYGASQGSLTLTRYASTGLRAPHHPASVIHDPPIDEISWLVRDSAAYRTPGVVKSFVPLVEGSEPLLGTLTQDYPVFESMASTIANTLTSRHGTRFLVSIHGVGSMPISSLNKSAFPDFEHAIALADLHPSLSGWATGPYANGLHQVLRAQEIAQSQQLTYKVAALVWIQADGTDDADYSQQLSQLINDYNHDIQLLTGQTEDVVVFMEQPQWEPTAKPTRVDEEFWAVHRDLDPQTHHGGRACLVGPRYPVPCPVHYLPVGVRSQGARFANAMERILFAGQPWEPLSPRAVRVEGHRVEIDFHVPFGTLNAGTTTNLGAIDPFLGFHIPNELGQEIIQKVTIEDADTVVLACSEDPLGRTVSYARVKQGAGTVQKGYLCDTAAPPTFYRAANGADLDSRDFCIAFEVPIPWTESEQIVTQAVLLQAPLFDADEDGLPDAWELESFGNLSRATAWSDQDGDGLSDLAEFMADLDPTDPTDRPVLKRSGLEPVPGQLDLVWHRLPGRRYALETSRDLVHWERWEEVYSARADSEESVIRVPFLASGAYFRVVLLPK